MLPNKKPLKLSHKMSNKQTTASAATAKALQKTIKRRAAKTNTENYIYFSVFIFYDSICICL